MAEGVLAEIVRRKRSDVETRLKGVTLDPEPAQRSLRSALARPGARFIMEIKKASPSGHRSRVSVDDAASAYGPVADAISVLTDEPFFDGSLWDIDAVRAKFDGPILAKDFVIDPRQVTEARAHGADAVLAILSVLDDSEVASVMAEAARLNMDVVVEAHDELEVRRAVALGAQIFGINNRDLKTLSTDLAVTERLAGLLPDERILVSESGIQSRSDVERLAERVDAFLVGSSLMAADNVAFAARSLVHGPVKICGLTSEADIAAAADAGATHAGLVLAEDNPRRVGREGSALVAEAQHRGLRAVGVFRDQSCAEIASAANSFGLDAVQLHGREGELDRLRTELPDSCEIWAACGVDNKPEPARAGADRTLFDTMVGGRSGGMGRPFDWRLIAGRPDLCRSFLAGGIGPHNARAAQQVGAFGIDVGSGVEAAPGRKDAGKLDSLFAALRPPCRRSSPC